MNRLHYLFLLFLSLPVWLLSSGCRRPQTTEQDVNFVALESKEGLSFSGRYPGIDNLQRSEAIKNGNTGRQFANQRGYMKAFGALIKVIPYYNADSEVRLRLPLFYVDLAKTAIGNTDYETAIKAYNLALNYDSLLLNANGQSLRGSILLEVCLIYKNLKQYKQAKDFLQQGEELARNYNNIHLKIECQLMKGEIALGQKYYDKALKQFKRADSTAPLYGFADLKIAAINNLARFYCITDSVRPALAIAGEIKDTIASMMAAKNIDSTQLFMLLATSGKVYYTVRQYAAAENLFKNALQYYRTQNQPQDIVDTYNDLYKTYKTEHKVAEALATLEEYIEVNNKLINGKVLRNAGEMALKFQVSERDRKLAGHQLELANEQAEGKAAIQRWAAFAGVLFIGLLLLAIYQIMQKNKLGLLKKEQQINMYKAVMQGEEHERLRIAEDLHDGIGALLATVKLDIARNAAAGNKHSRNDYRDPALLVNEIAEEVRRIAHNLMPDILLKNTIEQAFMIYCNNVRHSTGIDVKLQYNAQLDNCSHQSKLFLYRITQELLQNVIKHAAATEVFLQIRQAEDILNITFEDNGKGFNQEIGNEGTGLKNIAIRVAALGGEMEISSSPGNGTITYLFFYISLLEQYSTI